MMKGFISCNYLQGIVIVRVGKDGGLPHGGSVLFKVELPFKMATMGGVVARARAAKYPETPHLSSKWQNGGEIK
jgi:hypothetical protein